MSPATLGTLICRGIGLGFTIAGFTGLLPYLLFHPLFAPVRPGPITGVWASPFLLLSSPFGYELDSILLNLIFGVLLLLFSRPVGRWLALGLSTAA